MHEKLAASFDEMTKSFKGSAREAGREPYIHGAKPVCVRISQIDDTRKYLFELEDGNVIESVLMKYKHGNSVCISSLRSAAGWAAVSASTLDGLERNLTPSEDARSRFTDTERHGRTCFKCGCNGFRRTAGQL